MLLSGDELGRTQRGNNNAYNQDNEVSWLDWAPATREAEMLPFVRSLIALRRAHPLLRHGTRSLVATAPPTLFITPAGVDDGPDAALVLALNPTDAMAIAHLPLEQPGGWIRYLDSADPGPPGRAPATEEATFELRGRSVVLLGRPLEQPR
jgi:pullulanase/glycogen debranching enzyme